MHIKTARPLPPIPTTTPSVSPQKTASAQHAAPVEQKAATSRPLPRPPHTNPGVKTSVLASPEEQINVEQHIEKASPEQMVQNASQIPSLSKLGKPSVYKQMPPQGSSTAMSNAVQQLQKHQQNNMQLTQLSYQIAEKLPQPERKNFKAIEQLKNTHRNAEFSRQMQFSTVLILPGNAQLSQRMSLAATNQQARFGEAEEMLKLKLSQAGNDSEKVSEVMQSHQQQIKEINLQFQAEIVVGDGVAALLEGRPSHNANRTALANHHLEKNVAIQKQKVGLLNEKTQTQGQIQNLTSDILGVKDQIQDDKVKIGKLQKDIEYLELEMSSPLELPKPKFSAAEIQHLEDRIEQFSKQIDTLKKTPGSRVPVSELFTFEEQNTRQFRFPTADAESPSGRVSADELHTGQLKALNSKKDQMQRTLKTALEHSPTEGLKKDVARTSQSIAQLKEDPNMSSLKLKKLMIQKDEQEVLVNEALKKDSERDLELTAQHQDRITQKQGQIKSIQSQISDLEAGIVSQTEQVPILQSQIKDLEGSVELTTMKEKQLDLESKGQHMLVQASHMLSGLA